MWGFCCTVPQTLSSGSSVAFLLESTANLYSAMVLQSGMTLSGVEAIARAPTTVSRSSLVSLSEASGVILLSSAEEPLFGLGLFEQACPRRKASRDSLRSREDFSFSGSRCFPRFLVAKWDHRRTGKSDPSSHIQQLQFKANSLGVHEPK